jgi:hypothetical protein
MTEFTCDNCRDTFIKNWTDAEAKKELNESPWNIPGDEICILCDNCFEIFQKWFASLTPEEHEKIRAEADKHGKDK